MHQIVTYSRPQATRILSTLLLCWLLPWLSQAQCPTPNDRDQIVLSTQAEVNAFPPGCTILRESLIIQGNDINNLQGRGNLHTVLSNLEITGNGSLTSLTGLQNLTSVDGDLRIQNNATLTSITALSALTRTLFSLLIQDNATLTSLTGLQRLTGVVFNLQITGNGSLTSLTGLQSLTSVGLDLRIQNNATLTSITSLGALTQTGRSLQIIDNGSLTSLTGLQSLTSVGLDIRIDNNATLTSLTALSALTRIGGNLSITSNPNLSTCAIPPICQFLANGRGSVNIANNAPGCQSRQEVQAYCSPLAITTQPPSSSTLCAGATVTATISTTGTVVDYQWYRNGQLVDGQTTATLSLTNVQTQQAGAYRVVVGNSVSNLTSTAFVLTVNQPTVSLTNSGPLACNQPVVTLTASVSGFVGSPTFVFSSSATQQGSSNTASVTQTGVYSVTATGASNCVATAQTTVTANELPPAPTSSTQATPNGLVVQVGGGVGYERLKSIEQFNGYQIRQSEINQTGYFLITQPGPYAIAVIGANGCRATVAGVAN